MKKTVMLIALFVGFMGFSQEKDEYREDAVKLVKLQSGDQMMAILGPVVDRMVPEENKEAFTKEVQASLEKLYPSLATIYMESFTHEEINKMLEFYNSPIGKKMLKELPTITQKSMEIGRQWAQAEMMPLVRKYQTTQTEEGKN
jgi:hypothetical protein